MITKNEIALLAADAVEAVVAVNVGKHTGDSRVEKIILAAINRATAQLETQLADAKLPRVEEVQLVYQNTALHGIIKEYLKLAGSGYKGSDYTELRKMVEERYAPLRVSNRPN